LESDRVWTFLANNLVLNSQNKVQRDKVTEILQDRKKIQIEYQNMKYLEENKIREQKPNAQNDMAMKENEF
jgi:hypothetical protein